jgi:4-amino-4-deoxy-L-arabinose transferase-like glycosyltransferase
MRTESGPLTRTGSSIWPWLALLALALAVYVYGIGGQYVPTNGDELVYAHIARLTAASGHWLPLVSDLPNMRNTKPPLLFWQALAAGDWGRSWSMAALRLPSLVYTFLTVGLIAWVVQGLTGDKARGLLAACIYLAFFSTFHYGRPYLTSAPETFWLCLPMLGLLSQFFKSFEPADQENLVLKAPLSTAFLVFTGLAWGLGSAYKSFALIAPAAAALWCAALLSHRQWQFKPLWALSLRTAASVALGVGVFALWFALDPDPAAVWQEFVVGENVGKMGDKVGYWHEAVFGGGSSMWALVLSPLENAGLLAFAVMGLAFAGWHNRRAISAWAPHTQVLLAWLAVWVLVFMLPSQRSARYVIPAMPALAILLALSWHQIGRGWFLACGVLIALTTLVFGRVAWAMHAFGLASTSEFLTAAIAQGLVIALLLAGLAKPAWTRSATLAGCLFFYGAFSLTVAPLDGPQGRYGNDVKAVFKQQTIAVPSNFNAQWERFEFLLPGNRIVPFDMALMTAGNTASVAKLAELLQQHDAVVWGQADPAQTTPPCQAPCRVLAERWVVKERHKSGDITAANLWSLSWLFSREWIVVSKR